MKNFNWGHGITLFYLVFVGVLATVLFKSFGVDHSLVVDDYYNQDLAYQATYEKATNALTDIVIDIDHEPSTHTLSISLGEDADCIGTLKMYRPNDKSQDFSVAIQSNKVVIDTEQIASGRWIIKADWRTADKAYYQEESIVL